MATRKRRRRRHSTTRRRRNPPTRAATSYRSNPKRRRHYRRNPSFSVGGITNRLTDAGKGALFIVGGEAGTRFVRAKLLGWPDGQTKSTLADVGIGIGLGIAAEKMIGRQAARDLTAGALAYVLRSTAKQLNNTTLNSILGDASGVRRLVLRNGRFVPAPMGSYVGRGNGAPRLSGYYGRGTGANTDLADLGME